MNNQKLFLITVIIGFVSFVSKAQSHSDSIHFHRNFWRTNFYQDNYRINFNQLPGLLSLNGEAMHLMNQARTNKTVSTILSSAGAILVGWELGILIVGGDPNWVVGGIGGGLLIVSLPFNSKANNLAIQAVEQHNSSVITSSRGPIFFFGVTSNGCGLVLKF